MLYDTFTVPETIPDKSVIDTETATSSPYLALAEVDAVTTAMAKVFTARTDIITVASTIQIILFVFIIIHPHPQIYC